MSRRLLVRCKNGLPKFFWWRGQQYTVRAVLERWKDTGRWWEGERPKFFFRLQTSGGGLWEVYFDPAERAWFLYKIYD